MTTKKIEFSYAVQIQPFNGQELVEYPRGLTLDGVRVWTNHERRAYPQAERQVHTGFALVTERGTLLVYAVPENELPSE